MGMKVVTAFNDLTMREVQGLAYSLVSGNYNIVPSKPAENNKPEGIIYSFTTQDSYRYILDDPYADFEYFSFEYASDGDRIAIPMGVYGCSTTHKVYFPLQLNSFGRAFIMLPFEDFDKIYPSPDTNIARVKYSNLLQVREGFIKKIFDYYYNLNETFNSIMAWSARRPNSPTRKIAEAVHFKRMEIGENNNRSEVYFKKEFHEKEFDYLIQCGTRWDAVFNEAQKKNGSTTQRNNNMQGEDNRLFIFYQIIVN